MLKKIKNFFAIFLILMLLLVFFIIIISNLLLLKKVKINNNQCCASQSAYICIFYDYVANFEIRIMTFILNDEYCQVIYECCACFCVAWGGSRLLHE